MLEGTKYFEKPSQEYSVNVSMFASCLKNST